MEIIKARRSWTDVLQTLGDHGCKLRLLHPAKFSITIVGGKKDIPNLSTNPALQKVLEGKLQPKEANCTGNR